MIRETLARKGVGAEVAWLGGDRATPLSGRSYFLLGPVMAVHGRILGKSRKKLRIAERG
jgi:hypothetical protein